MSRRRLFSVLFVVALVSSFMWAFGSPVTAADASIEQGTPARPLVTTKMTKTVDQWSTLVSSHDLRVLDLMSTKAQVDLLSATDSAKLAESLNANFAVSILDVRNPRVFADGTSGMEVSFSGFYLPNAYSTMEIRFYDKGAEYLEITSAKLTQTVFPEVDKVARLQLDFTLDGAVLSQNVVSRQDFLLIRVTNSDDQTHVVTVGSADGSELARGSVAPGESGEIAIAGLTEGDYTVVDQWQATVNPFSLTIK